MTERYSYAELKRAQAQCAEKAADAAVATCGTTSEAQKAVFRAHVNDLCASVFTAALRQYNPVSKENLEPVDEELLKRVKELEKALKKKENGLQALREKVPRLAALQTRVKLEKERKRNAEVLFVASESNEEPLELEESNVEALKETFAKTSRSITEASSKLDRMMSQTNETIDVVERAMKRPKTEIDEAMEKSPTKLSLIQTVTTPEDAGSLRSRLALHGCPAKNA
ncbi:hypothetical protein Poli38472_002676 [Pythium oligandrum]|uniref:Uncharacterized protein n=1 Tax=Pythium oligandrum TaxID=41045 RepID=A0A8K1FHB8_PYTOL|nr:hypothetical protein Poli38472_002676 [Pythium oligandrum]|eukprot:TMW63735.1 hypothetical protein Poli38472_002676 [Pythium oligandrum]